MTAAWISTAAPPADLDLRRFRRTAAARPRPLAVLAFAALLLLALATHDKWQETPTKAHLPWVPVVDMGQDALLHTGASTSAGASAVRADRLDSSVSAAHTYQQGRFAASGLAHHAKAHHAVSAEQLGVSGMRTDPVTAIQQQDLRLAEPHRALVGALAAGEAGAAMAGASGAGSAAARDANANRPAVFLFAGVLSGRGYRHRRLAVREAWADRAQARLTRPVEPTQHGHTAALMIRHRSWHFIVVSLLL